MVEECMFRNALRGHQPGAVAKNQANRGVFRFNVYARGDSFMIKVDRNHGQDGSVTESKWYHITCDDVGTILRTNENTATFNNLHFETSHKNNIYQNLGAGDPARLGTFIYKGDQSNRGIYATGWKGDKWSAITIDTPVGFRISLNDNTGGWQDKTVAQALTDWPDNFSNWQEEVVNFTSVNDALTSWDFDVARTGMTPLNPPPSVSDVEPLTTMVGAGNNALGGTLDDGRYFILADTHWGLGYFGEQNDQIAINGQFVRLVTLNKNTGVATWDRPISWSNGDPVFYVYKGAIPTKRGAIQ